MSPSPRRAPWFVALLVVAIAIWDPARPAHAGSGGNTARAPSRRVSLFVCPPTA